MKIKTLAKISIFILFGYLLMYQDLLDFTVMGDLLKSPGLILKILVVAFIFPSFLVVLRWMMILKELGAEITFRRLYELHWTSFFLSLFLPGTSSADVIKAVYLHREKRLDSKTAILTSLLWDRILGLCGLVMIAFIATFSSLVAAADLEAMRIIVIAARIAFALMMLGLIWAMIPLPAEKDPIKKIIDLLPRNQRILKIYFTFFKLRAKGKALAIGVLASSLVQVCQVIAFIFLTQFLLGDNFMISSLFLILPFGELAQIIPLTPGGFGVGHYTYEFFYEQVNLSYGANAFNLYFVIRFAVGLLGAIPFLFHSKGFEELQGEVKHFSDLEAED